MPAPTQDSREREVRVIFDDCGILAVNGGSSSIKFALFEPRNGLRRILEGRIERIGLAGAALVMNGEAFRAAEAPDHAAALELLIREVEARRGRNRLTAIAHRVVHGGPHFSEPQRLTPEVVEALRRISAFDPQHLPAEILLIEALQRRYPQLPQIACFDTAFHHDLPRVARLLPIPRRYEALGIRRYGFHGLSYGFLMRELARVAGDRAARGRVILAHLGNGASLAAVREGMPVDTSMGFTPASGVPMSTRSGDLDPGLVAYLAAAEGMDARQFDELVNARSGLLGISEISPDMRDLLEREAGDVRAAEAVALFCYQVRKCIGSFAAALGGVDTLVFAGGIGERAPAVRARICEGLAFLGIEIDEKLNTGGACVISAGAGRVAVRVMRTDEELMIAKLTCGVLGITVETDGETGS
jgi:acetate kinase